jgi:hypothetical protein
MSFPRLLARSSVVLGLLLWLAGPAYSQNRSVSSTTSPVVETTTRTIVNAHAAHQALLQALAMAMPEDLSARDRATWDRQTAVYRDAERRYRGFRGRMKQSLQKGVAPVTIDVAGAAMPGASEISAAVNGALGGSFGTRSGSSGNDLVESMMQMNMEFLELQAALNSESRKYQTLSNALKARADVVMNAVDYT